MPEILQMSTDLQTSSKSGLRIGRRILAIIAGVLVTALPAVATDLILAATDFFPNYGKERLADHLLVVATIYRFIYGVGGSYVAAKIAPDRPMAHSLFLGVLGTFLGIVGVVTTWNAGPIYEPKWYAIMIAVIALPSAWLGALLPVRQR
jgi:hypothetical protein